MNKICNSKIKDNLNKAAKESVSVAKNLNL